MSEKIEMTQSTHCNIQRLILGKSSKKKKDKLGLLGQPKEVRGWKGLGVPNPLNRFIKPKVVLFFWKAFLTRCSWCVCLQISTERYKIRPPKNENDTQKTIGFHPFSLKN